MAVNQTVAPTSEPLTTAEAKAHLKVDTSDEDTLIDAYVTAARGWCEQYLRRQLITATWELLLEDFYQESIPLPWAPLQSITSIVYTDSDGVSQTVSSSDYTVDIKSTPGQVYPVYGEYWPTPRAERNAVTITYVAGYGAASAVPEEIRTAIRLLVGHYYEHRGDEGAGVPPVVEAMLYPHRVFGVPIADYDRGI
jgi:uncharacterized phiE125 gp8 family phage protein